MSESGSEREGVREGKSIMKVRIKVKSKEWFLVLPSRF